MATLEQELERIAAQIHTDPNELIAFAEEDQLGGYHWNPDLATFKQGSCWGVEGQMLYALIRWLKPDVVAEIGGWAGCSGSHIALALIKNGKGRLYSVDNEVGGQPHGEDMPDDYRALTTLIRANGEDWLANQPDGSIGLVFEDASHGTDLVAKISALALKKVQPGGLLVNHDAAHDFAYVGGGQMVTSSVGREVRDGLAIANAYFRVYRAEPSDCGIALTVIPGAKSIPTMTVSEAVVFQQLGNANIESVPEPPPVTEKKTRNRKPKV